MVSICSGDTSVYLYFSIYRRPSEETCKQLKEPSISCCAPFPDHLRPAGYKQAQIKPRFSPMEPSGEGGGSVPQRAGLGNGCQMGCWSQGQARSPSRVWTCVVWKHYLGETKYYLGEMPQEYKRGQGKERDAAG